MKNKVQQWPEIVFKFYKLAIILHWPEQIPLITINYKTAKTRPTKFCTHMWVTRLIGPVYWVSEFHMEVVKKNDRKRNV